MGQRFRFRRLGFSVSWIGLRAFHTEDGAPSLCFGRDDHSFRVAGAAPLGVGGRGGDAFLRYFYRIGHLAGGGTRERPVEAAYINGFAASDFALNGGMHGGEELVAEFV